MFAPSLPGSAFMQPMEAIDPLPVALVEGKWPVLRVATCRRARRSAPPRIIGHE
jgi:hypothetical protein